MHHCHAEGCATPCKPELLMCYAHWKMVPGRLQHAVLQTYRRGQCDDKRPSLGWCEAADAAVAVVAAKEGEQVHPRTTFRRSFYPTDAENKEVLARIDRMRRGEPADPPPRKN